MAKKKDGVIKYKGKSLGWLLAKTQEYFNRYIRLRDTGLPCISCGNPMPPGTAENASHLYPVKGFPTLRFDERNVHKSCVYCNGFLEGNTAEYLDRLPARIGQNAVDELRKKKEEDKKKNFKWQRHEVIDLLELYKQKCKEAELSQYLR